MSIHVLHLIGGGEIGGAEQNVLHLLQSYDQQTYHVSLGCLVKESPFASLTRSLGIQTVVFPMHFAMDISPVFQMIRFCHQHSVDLLHCHGTRANLVGRLAGKIAGIPCITTVHSLPEFDYPTARKGQLALYLDNLTLSLSSGLITVSDNLRTQVDIRLQAKDLPLPLITVYNGVNVLDFSSRSSVRSAYRRQLGIGDHCKLIGTIGRLHPVKGQRDLIEATKKLRTDFPDLHLILIGEGPYREQLQQHLISAQIPHTLTGYLPDAWKLLPAMDLFVLPSLSEGMGLVLLEAAQAEVPIVASRVGGIPELLRDNVDALLSDPSDPENLMIACRRILQNQALANRLTSSAHQRAMRFTVKKMAMDTAIFYDHVLANAKF